MHFFLRRLHLLILAACLGLVVTVSGDPPEWWSQVDAQGFRVIDPNITDSNPKGPANIGQAKHMAKRALDALRPILPAVTSQIEAELVGPEKPIPNWDPPEDQSGRDKNHAPLLIGQLKAISAPFYDALNTAAPLWLDNESEIQAEKGQLQLNGTKDPDPNHPEHYYPWTFAETDDQNKAIATIGQLKAVFSLRFERDSDSSGFSDLLEINYFVQTGIDPNGDIDGDGLTNLQEYLLGTSPVIRDTDGDGIADKLDAAPLLGYPTFSDADGDGIADSDDSTPNDPRGAPPAISSQTASGSTTVNVVAGEPLVFLLTVDNPTGPPVTASNLKLFVGGAEETAVFSPVGTNQFSLAWDAKTHANYPDEILQSIAVRFQDSQHATAWLALARCDVAEWEGLVAGARNAHPNESWSVTIASHLNGAKINPGNGVHYSPAWVSRTSGDTFWYRGPKLMKLLDFDSKVQKGDVNIADSVYPFFLISQKSDGNYEGTRMIDMGLSAAHPVHQDFFSNHVGAKLRISSNSHSLPLDVGKTGFISYPESQMGEGYAYPFEIFKPKEIGGEDGVYAGFCEVMMPRSARRLRQFNFYPGTHPSDPVFFSTTTLAAKVAAKIIPHTAGTLGGSGLPMNPGDATPLVPMASGTWHRFVLKVGLDAVAVSDGLEIVLGTGIGGGVAPQPGFEIQKRTATGFEPITVSTDGKILLAPGTGQYQELTSPAGMELFIKRAVTVTDLHELRIQLTPKNAEWEHPTVAQADLLPAEIVSDWNRDGEINVADRGKVTGENPWRFWINDNDDAGTVDGSDIPNGGTNGQDNQINGIRDLVDWFPLHLDIKSILENFPSATHEYFLENEDNALNALETTLAPANSGNYLKAELGEPGHRDNPNGIALAHWSYYREIHGRNAKLSADFLTGIKNGTGGILILEANKATSKPLRLVVRKKSGGQEVLETQFPLSVSGVEKMYRHLNILGPNGQSGGMSTNLDEPINQPDAEANSKNFVFVHGYNVNPNQARGWNAAMFKRLWHSGSRAKFTGLTWYGYESQGSVPGHPDVTPNYQANVLNAFATASALKDGLEPLEGEVYIAAHSLGNIVVSSAMHDFGFAAEKYFLIDAAVAKESYDETEEQRLIMSNPWWEDYDDQLRATDWHLLPWPENDWRAKLTWVNRLKDIGNAYNFYSSGEEVLKNPQHGPSPLPISAEGVWAAQEKRKGFGLTGQILTSTYGGWDTNKHVDYGIRVTHGGVLVDFIPRTQVELGPVDGAFKQKLMQIPFFNTGFDPVTGQTLGTAPNDIADLLGPNGSDYASPPQKRNTLLAEMIPAQTTAAGSNSINSFGNDRNFDMNAMKTGWPATRPPGSGWWHSDLQNVSYTYTFLAFDKITETANLSN